MAAHAGDLIKVVALLMQAGKKKSLVTPPLDIAGHFYGGCQRQR